MTQLDLPLEQAITFKPINDFELGDCDLCGEKVDPVLPEYAGICEKCFDKVMGMHAKNQIDEQRRDDCVGGSKISKGSDLTPCDLF